jgi:hypothetical protein
MAWNEVEVGLALKLDIYLYLFHERCLYFVNAAVHHPQCPAISSPNVSWVRAQGVG